MATSVASDFKVYQQQFFGGMTETLQQAVEVMNASSNGAIAMTTERMRGDFEYESFFESLATLVSRQDTSSTSPATAVKLTQDEIVRVKLHRKIGPVEVTRKAFLQIGQDPELASFILGQQTAQAVAENMLNSALLAARVSLANTTAVMNDVTGSSVRHTTHKNLINTLRKFGDKQGRIVAWVLHSSNWFDLSVDGVENQIDSIASDIIRVLEVPGHRCSSHSHWPGHIPLKPHTDHLVPEALYGQLASAKWSCMMRSKRRTSSSDHFCRPSAAIS